MVGKHGVQADGGLAVDTVQSARAGRDVWVSVMIFSRESLSPALAAMQLDAMRGDLMTDWPKHVVFVLLQA